MTPVTDIGFKKPDLLLPNPNIDMQKWAVVACDQFTSEPEYWQHVERVVGESPSTYHLILPETMLGTSEEERRILSTQAAMKQYLQTGIFTCVNEFIYVLRTVGKHTRRGLMACLDLEQYDYTKGSQTLVRATEGTILDRLPPRIRIREGASLECPHILILFDDPNDTVFGPIDDQLEKLERLYSFDLMMNSGHLTGILLEDEGMTQHIFESFTALIDPNIFAEKYNLKPGHYKPLLFAAGDGNHSLATAKAIWETIKPVAGMDHPARYALVELENVHDPALTFEPIHRLLFGINQNILKTMQSHWGSRLSTKEIEDEAQMIQMVDANEENWHQIGMITSEGIKLLEIQNSKENLAIGTLQSFLDGFLDQGGAKKIDYIHGTKILFEQGQQPGNAGFYLPGMDKSDLFKTVILDGALPRKTFSMGEAKEKRFYMECRRI